METKKTKITLSDGRIIEVDPSKSVKITKAQFEEMTKNRKIVGSDAPPVSRSLKKPSVKVEQPKDANVITINRREDIQLREETVQEIMTAVPHWMIRWGNTLFCSLVVLLLAITWFVQYPDTLEAPVQIFSANPQQKIQLHTDGYTWQPFVVDGQSIEKGNLIAATQSNTDIEDLILLAGVFDSLNTFSKHLLFPFDELPPLVLGDLQTSYLKLKYSHDNFWLNKDLSNRYGPDSENHLALIKLQMELINDFELLKNKLSDFNASNLVFAKQSGRILLNSSQLIVKPESDQSYMAQLVIPVENSGKVKNAQKVQIKLHNYPYLEYGMLEGEIKSISEKEQSYLVEVELPNQLLTSYNKEVSFNNNLVGSGSIILKKTRLLDRFIKLTR